MPGQNAFSLFHDECEEATDGQNGYVLHCAGLTG